jgi:hypothetical protein
MTPGELLVIGITAGMILCALLNELLHWTPSWRELLTAMSAAILIDLAINNRRDVDLADAAATHSSDGVGVPHVCPCVALAFIGVLAVLHVMREE